MLNPLDFETRVKRLSATEEQDAATSSEAEE